MSSGVVVWNPPVDLGRLDSLVQRWESDGLTVERGRSLGAMTTFGIGGPAGAFVTVEDRSELLRFVGAFDGDDATAVPVMVIGKGSNLLVADAGFPGAVLKLGTGFRHISRDGLMVTAGASEAMPALADWVAKRGLAGLEFAAGIPATVGGSVRMNAGAHGSSTAEPLIEIELVTPGQDVVQTARVDSLGFSYRHSELPQGAVVISATWLLVQDEPGNIKARLNELRAYRRATQPLRERNCGSVFTNPEADSAGRLIEAAGLKGHTIGGATVSLKHANFITVTTAASADDVLRLIGHIRQVVAEGGGPLLLPEVRVVGAFASDHA